MDTTTHLCGGLVLRGHAVAHRHAGILPASLLLLLLQVLVVGHLLLLFIGHVARVNPCGTRHVRLLGVDIGMGHILRRLGGHFRGIDTVLIGSGIGGIEASLRFKKRQSSSIPCHCPLRASNSLSVKGRKVSFDSPG